MASFIINTWNSIEFKARNNLSPNYDNTLLREIKFDGVVNSNYTHKFLQSKPIVTQIFTDFDVNLGDTVEAFLVDSNKTSTPLTVVKVKQKTDEIHGNEQIFYEFTIAGQPEGCYHVTVKGTQSGTSNVYHESEVFEIKKGVIDYRYGSDGTKFTYEEIPNHVKIEAFNRDNLPSLYFGSDRITGDPFRIELWVEATIFKSQQAGETDVYNDTGNLSVLRSIKQRSFEFKTSSIPMYLAMKIGELSGLDFFIVNDIEYVNEELGENEYFGNLTDPVMTMNLTQKHVVGVNSDDQGQPIIDSTMGGVEIPEKTISGSDQLIITGAYTISLITLELKTGSQADITIGFTPGGNEIMHTNSVDTLNPIRYVARTFGNLEDINASFPAYISVVGVGASVLVRIQTVPNSQ